MKRIHISALVVLLIMFLPGCYDQPKEYHPQDGTWFCEELQVQLCFDPESYATAAFYENKVYMQMDDEEYYDSFIVWDGQMFRCSAHCKRNSPYLFIQYDDPRFNDTQCKLYDIGYHFYETEIVSLSDNQMVLKDQHTAEKYIFLRKTD